MKVVHATVPGPTTTGQVGYTQWAEDHTISNPFTTVAYAATVTLASNTNNRIILTGNIVVSLGTGSDGALVYLWVTASGSSYTVTINAAVRIPTSSTFTSPVTVASGTKSCFVFQYDSTLNGGQWELHQYIYGY